jgi:tRNA/rRNA methyltransferase
VAAGDRVGIMFGREKWGLTNEEVALADALLTFPVNPAFASLNIAQSVLLVSYVWMASGLNGRLPTRSGLPEVDTRPAEKVHLMGFLRRLEAALSGTAYFRSAAMKPTLVANLHSVFQRAGMARGELDVLHGVIDAFERQRRRDKGDE